MARSRRTKLFVSKHRDTSDIANLDELVFDRRQPSRRFPDDERAFHFEGPNRPPLETSGVPATYGMVPAGVLRKPIRKTSWRVVRGPGGAPLKSRTRVGAKKLRPLSFARDVFAFARPGRVVTCIKRKMRREVLFALNKTRSGRGRARRRTWRSNIRC